MHHRKQERALLKRKLESGISIHMPAPRRIGKTWTANRLATDLRDSGWVAVEVDVEGIRTPREFARELCVRIEDQKPVTERFLTKLRHRFNNVLDGTQGNTPLEALSRVDPIEFSETLIASLSESHHKTSIIIDEIAYFFLALAETDAKEAHAFAYKLRALQQRHKNVLWLLTGSIGLHTIARRYDLEGAFVDFENYTLDPFTVEQALSYMRDPNIQQQFNHIFDASDDDFTEMFNNLGWLAPYYLKMVANEVRPTVRGDGGGHPKATKSDFEAAFAKLLQPNRRSEFAVWPNTSARTFPPPTVPLPRLYSTPCHNTPRGNTKRHCSPKSSPSRAA